MPAIQITRLKAQIGLLERKFAQPPEFIRGLRELFDFYAYRVYKPGQTVPPTNLLPAYHIPPLVMLRLQSSLRPLCLAREAEALALVDALWEEKMVEPRILAAHLLGTIPLTSSVAVLQRLQQWSTPAEDRPILQALLNSGTTTLRREDVRGWITVIQAWLNAPDPAVQAVGLHALLPLVNDPRFENLPAVFSAITPLLQSAPPNLQSDLQDILEACARRSPIETGYLLRQLLSLSTAPGLTRLTRRVFNQFSPATQASLRTLLQSRES